ncbi:MAG: hypothetical protein IKP20_05355 [Candidatus Methanomethylophilaceae archaeon]|nr:hypothetical protein [Candidatus Methanomethylophilaceae archaeon]
MAPMAPVYIESGDRLITVFGGGNVALRKIRHFEGFRIRVIARDILPEIRDIADECVQCDITPETVRDNLPGTFIAVAATDSKSLNAMVRDSAKESGVPVNSAHGGGDILIPSTIRRRNYSVCVSSEGRVPAFPPYVAEILEPVLDDSLDDMMDLMVRMRPIVMSEIPEQKRRAEILRDILHDESIWESIRAGDHQKAFETAERKVIQ